MRAAYLWIVAATIATVLLSQTRINSGSQITPVNVADLVGPQSGLMVINNKLFIDTAVLTTLFVSIQTGGLMASGAKITAQGSQTKAAIRLTGQADPPLSQLQGGDVWMSEAGKLRYFDGSKKLEASTVVIP